ncbi:hypothetical protein Zm00014a_029633 [Zea mays]|uniref:Uncharacterized protein n=1 Tax=Zea mays TaxID=4577 RepID=A0A3L6GBE4_MAIZE|nr:hypothetical protein Zm00014a_029633 [Zea mays]
MKYAKLVA